MGRKIVKRGKSYINSALEISDVLGSDMRDKPEAIWASMSSGDKVNLIIGVVLLVTVISVVLYIAYPADNWIKATLLRKYLSDNATSTLLVCSMLVFTGLLHLYMAFAGCSYGSLNAQLASELKWLDYSITVSLMAIVALMTMSEESRPSQYVFMSAVALSLVIVLASYWSDMMPRHDITKTKKRWYLLGLSVFCFSLMLGYLHSEYQFHRQNATLRLQNYLPALNLVIVLFVLLIMQMLLIGTTRDNSHLSQRTTDTFHKWFLLSSKVSFTASYIITVHPKISS